MVPVSVHFASAVGGDLVADLGLYGENLTLCGLRPTTIHTTLSAFGDLLDASMADTRHVVSDTSGNDRVSGIVGWNSLRGG
ncbi:hypothetical protein RDV64_17495 [Acuticoccus sp. MNP-M23]|uniref:hypothetical protein n=1 Tax=Acuticoccus sp. MNP-M23 TaxID=3072793 RepID=UPI0028159D5E|nr:hypothetical protein [Acuticoccus sp. MNP-M23]WMS41844.1 hypothetical protein RDV64_17495 [Acuticoccus sp. MNP-M23]